MAIVEKDLPGGQYEIKATGEDIPKLSGLLDKTAKESYRAAFHKNEGNWERITDPQGNPTHVPKNEVEEYRARGYGRVSLNPTFVVPELPWQKNHIARPGKRRYRFDPRTQDMVEVS